MFSSNLHLMNKLIISFLLLLCLAVSSGCVGSDTDVAPHPLEFVNVTEVIDGDTIVVSSGERVRLIGVDTPEVGEPYYSEAKQYMVHRVLGKVIGLEKDVSETDVYGRLLRYVWVKDEMVNKELVLSGLAFSKTYSPDTHYQDIFDSAEVVAKENGVGLWSVPVMAEDSVTISYLEAGRYIGQVVTVEGTIVQTTKKDDSGIIFLNFHDPYEGYFTVVIWSDDWNRFSQDPDVMYEGKHVLVTGKVIEYKGSPEIIVESPSQIVIIQ
ncbi:thermonuclease family protein [Methanococcoides sp. SA1]|nr:thermonuclease family protein [Methanococcoides sp. SA1]